MKYVFFDFETSDKNCIGQILTYAFVVTDEKFNIEDKLVDKIKISPTQLPRIAAIMTNKIDVLKHQVEANDDEPTAMIKIRSFLDKQMTKSDIMLVGYNSNKFDVPFLRTSMIRNGVNPYSRSMKLLDIYHLVQMLALKEPEFTDKLIDKTSLRLENLLQSFQVITDKQSHDAEDDVLNLIKLTKIINDDYYELSVFKAYEPKKNDKLVKMIMFGSSRAETIIDSYVLLEEDKTAALWINLREYAAQVGEKTKRCVYWFNKINGPRAFTLNEEQKHSEASAILAQEAVNALSHVNLKNYFDEKNCDVEQFIYMMGFDGNEALARAIDFENLEIVKNSGNRFANILYMRYLINKDPVQYEKVLKLYAEHRYGGRMKIDKNDNTTVWEEGKTYETEIFHATLETMIKEIFDCEVKDAEDETLRQSLHEFYTMSPVMRALKPTLSSAEAL